MPTSPAPPRSACPRSPTRAVKGFVFSSIRVARRRIRRARSAGATARQAGKAAFRARHPASLLDAGLLQLRDRLIGGRVEHG